MKVLQPTNILDFSQTFTVHNISIRFAIALLSVTIVLKLKIKYWLRIWCIKYHNKVKVEKPKTRLKISLETYALISQRVNTKMITWTRDSNHITPLPWLGED